MISGAPVAQAADIDFRLITAGHGSGAAIDLLFLTVDKRNQRLRPAGFIKYRAQQLQTLAESLVKDTVRTGFQGNDRNTQLLLQRIFLFNIFIFGNHDVGVTGQNFLGLGTLGIGPADSAGWQGGKHLFIGNDIRPGHAVKHLRPVIQGGFVNILNPGQQACIGNVAV